MPTLETKVEKPQLPEWKCELPKAPNKPEGYTVGEVFTVSCTGDALDLKAPLLLKMPEGFEYTLVLLKELEFTSARVSYEATTYRVSKNQLPFLHFADAEGKGFVSQPINVNSISVIEGTPPEAPYGPIVPMPMVWPLWLFFTGFVIALVLMGWLGIFLKKRIQRKNLEKNIRKFLSPMGSYHQYQKDVRILRRGVLFSERHQWTSSQVQNYIKELDEYFRMFLLREFTVPATTWSSRQTQKEIKQKTKVNYDKFRTPLRKALQELDRAKASTDKLQSQDCDQLTQIVSKAVDVIWKFKGRGSNV
jgi:hypothetical protein